MNIHSAAPDVKYFLRVTPRREPLPIDDVLAESLDRLAAAGTLVLVAAPGAGKTTRFPLALLESGLVNRGAIWLLEPRRAAARAAARRLAAEVGEEVGGTVGYATRDETRASVATRLLVLTEGILTRRLLDDPELAGVGAVILDEFHERSRHADLGLAFLREVRATVRPDLLLVVASATLDPAPAARFLGTADRPAPVVSSAGRRHPVEIRFDEVVDARPLETRVASAALALLDETDGDVLGFLPGAGEIRRAREELSARLPAGVRVLPLHGDLDASAQDEAIRRAPPGTRKVVLATNLAETSLTIDGVRAVVDAGLSRVLRFDASTGLDRLVLGRISKASAEQRAGRAGRQGPGLVRRLYTKADLHGTRAFEEPEILRTDLAEPVLHVLRWAARDPRAFEWFEDPPAPSLDRAVALLRRLGAVSPASFEITPLGRRLAALPLPPRLAAVALSAAEAGRARDGALLAALLAERDVLGRGDLARDAPTGDSDVLFRRDLVVESESGRAAPDLDRGAVRAVLAARDRIARLLPGARRGGAGDDGTLRRALLAGWPDRVGRRKPGSAEFALATGRSLPLGRESVVRDATLVVAHATAGGAGTAAERVTSATAIDARWLEDLPGGVVETDTRSFDAGRETVVARRTRAYGGLVLVEHVEAAPRDGETAALLAAEAARDPSRALGPREDVERLRARLAFLASIAPELDLPPLDDAAIARLLPALASGRRSFAELREADVPAAILASLGARQRDALRREAPEAIPIPTGRDARLDWTADGPVFAVKIQELFGLRATPRVGFGRTPVTVHLLSPAGRPVQVTRDLASFWASGYALARKELRGRYPRHPWPDDPLAAAPTRRAKPRPR